MKYIVILVLFLFVLSSCTGGLNVNRQIVTDEEFQVGTKTLFYDFHPSTPPDEMRVNSIEDIVLILENRGASDIEHGFMSLIVDPTFIALLGDPKRTFQAEGQNKYNPDGEMLQFVFPVQSLSLTDQSQQKTLEILANVCYDYVTEFNDIVCIDPDPFQRDERIAGQRVCETEDLRSSGQGAPIAVSHVRVQMSTDLDGTIRPTFSITIDNKADGLVVVKDRTRDLCTGNPLQVDDLNRVSIFAALGERPLTCEAYTAKLVDGKATFRCWDEFGLDASLGTYETPFHVRLSYGYSDTISRSFLLVR